MAIVISSMIAIVLYGGMEEVFARWDGFHLAIVVDLGHGRHCLAENQKGCPLGLFQR